MHRKVNNKKKRTDYIVSAIIVIGLSFIFLYREAELIQHATAVINDEEEYGISLQQLIQNNWYNNNKSNYNYDNIRPGIQKDVFKYNVTWPQMDDRIQQAILKYGRLINVDQTPVSFHQSTLGTNHRRRHLRIVHGRQSHRRHPLNKKKKILKKSNRPSPSTILGYYPCNKTANISTDNIISTTTLCESPPPNLATIVTAYYNVKSKHPTNDYIQWFSNFLAATDPMVIFVQPYNDLKNNNNNNNDTINWEEFVIKRRQHAPTIVVPLPFENLVMSTSFTDSFWKKVFEICDYPDDYKDLFAFRIYNEKLILTQNVAYLNPFNSHEIFWVDAGYFRSYSKNYTTIVRNNITKNGVPANKILLQNAMPYPHNPILAGGAWGGTPLALNRFYNYYFKTFWYMASNPQLADNDPDFCIGQEQHVFLHMCFNFPTLCHIQDHDHWFQMAETWLRNQNYWFASKVSSFSKFETSFIVNLTIQYPKNVTAIDRKFMDSYKPIYNEDNNYERKNN